jgi:hypothetical protein
MAENTRLKELTADVKRNAEAIEKMYNDFHAQIDKLEFANTSRFDRMEAMQLETDNKFSQIHNALDLLLNQSPHKSSHGAGNSNKQSFQVRNIKLEFPRFDGKNVLEWIFRAEQFFDYYGTPDPDRLTIASVHLDKDVVPWFQMMQRSHPFHSWVEFTRALELDFGPSIYECPRATLFKLSQNGTVADYYLQFTSLANIVYGLSNDAMIDCFISGLTPEIRRDVMIHSPIARVMSLSWSELENSIVRQLKETLQRDSKLLVIMQQCVEQPLLHPNYSVKGDLLYWKNRIVVPKDVNLLQQLLQEFHSSPIGGHSGLTRTLARVTQQFYWLDMKHDVQQYVQSCTICQQAKTLHTKPAGLLQPLPIPSQVWEDTYSNGLYNRTTKFLWLQCYIGSS